jgi:hypothetical protein
MTTQDLTTEQRIQRLRELLTQACDKYLQEGGTIICGRFTDGDVGCCPIQCAVGEGRKSAKDFLGTLSQLLGYEFTEKNLWNLVDGFDDNVMMNDTDTSEFQLGRELRAKYIGKEKT